MQKEKQVVGVFGVDSDEEQDSDHYRSRDYEHMPSQIVSGEHTGFDSLMQAIEGKKG